MNRSLLIASNADTHTEQLAHQAHSAGFTVVLAVADQAVGAESADAAGTGRIHRVAWNRCSPLSARALLVQAANVAAPITDVVYLHAPHARTTPFHETSAAGIEAVVDADTRGRLFFLKEALGSLQRSGGGSLTLLFDGDLSAESAPLDAESAGAFLALGRSLFTQYQNEPVQLRGLQSTGAAAEQFAHFVVQQLCAESSRQRGRWQRYSGKPTLFPFSR